MAVGFILAGSFGALLNCALASYFSSMVDNLLPEMLAQPLSAFRTLGPAVCGFFGGTLIVLTWKFLKVRVIRYLLQYNGWFLHPKRPSNRIWYLLVVALLGRKDKGSSRYQDYLPSYPLPNLKDTGKKYLQSVEPLLTEEEFSNTKKAVEKFLKKDGKRLQLILRLRTLRNRNWISDWWLDYIYLKQRTPISFNSNYYATGGGHTTSHQLDRAAMILHSTAMFYDDLQNGKLTNPRAMNVAPFCMDGHRYLHATVRDPGEDIDRIVSYASEKPRHGTILRNGKFYKFDLISPDGRVQTPLGIKRSLEKIVEMAGDDVDDRGVCSFTALPRTQWSKIRQGMLRQSVNEVTLRDIGSCLALVCLDTEYVDPNDFEAQARFLFHGSTHNRWFDKCVNLVVSSSGAVGANVEHSALDATVAGQMWEYHLTDEEYDETGHVLEPFRGQHSFHVLDPVHLQWDLEGLEEELEASKANLTKMISDSDLVIMHTYGKKIPKSCKLSPDGWFQMALQLTHYRMYKQFVLTYESATTRLYYKGRTETIRPVTTKSVQFCKVFDDPCVSHEEVKKLLRESIDMQCKYKMEAMRGMGVDRHLFGLYCVAKGTNMDPLPDIFTDKAFNLPFLLSTSQTPVRSTDRWRRDCSMEAGGFGTVTEDGYGVSYLVYEEYVSWSVHSKRSSPRTSSQQFADHLKQSMDDMRKLFNM